MDLGHWDTIPLDFQERTFGRKNILARRLANTKSFDSLDLNAKGKSSDLVIPANAYVRLAAPSSNGGSQIL